VLALAETVEHLTASSVLRIIWIDDLPYSCPTNGMKIQLGPPCCGFYSLFTQNNVGTIDNVLCRKRSGISIKRLHSDHIHGGMCARLDKLTFRSLEARALSRGARLRFIHILRLILRCRALRLILQRKVRRVETHKTLNEAPGGFNRLGCCRLLTELATMNDGSDLR
jgi:hypothetical protein